MDNQDEWAKVGKQIEAGIVEDARWLVDPKNPPYTPSFSQLVLIGEIAQLLQQIDKQGN